MEMFTVFFFICDSSKLERILTPFNQWGNKLWHIWTIKSHPEIKRIQLRYMQDVGKTAHSGEGTKRDTEAACYGIPSIGHPSKATL